MRRVGTFKNEIHLNYILMTKFISHGRGSIINATRLLVLPGIIAVYFWSHSKPTNTQLESAGFCLDSNAGGMHTMSQPLCFQRLQNTLYLWLESFRAIHEIKFSLASGHVNMQFMSSLPETGCVSVIKGLHGGLWVQVTSCDVYKPCMISFL